MNVKTGEVRILRFLSAHDSGRVMSRLTFDSQVIGGVTMGIGLAMTEMRILDRNQTGKIVTGNWHDYKIPTAMDVPAEIVSLPLDLPDNEANSTGAKGLGEPVTIPTAAAVANAVYNATGAEDDIDADQPGRAAPGAGGKKIRTRMTCCRRPPRWCQAAIEGEENQERGKRPGWQRYPKVREG